MIIFLYGPDTFRSRNKLNEFKNKFIKEIDGSGLNIQILNGAQLEFNALKNAVLAAPFLVKKRMVIVEGLLQNSLDDSWQKNTMELLQDPKTNDTIVIFWEGAIPAAKSRTKLFTFLKKQKYAYAFDALKPEQLGVWYNKLLADCAATMEPRALKRLMHIVGNDLWLAKTEIEKLSAYCKGKTITLADVEELSTDRLEDNIFAVTDSIGQKDFTSALRLIEQQIKLGTKEIELLGKFRWQLRNLLLAKGLLEERGRSITSWQLAEALGFHPYVAKKVMAQARNFQLGQLKRLYARLYDIDYKLKTGQTMPALLLELFCVNS